MYMTSYWRRMEIVGANFGLYGWRDQNLYIGTKYCDSIYGGCNYRTPWKMCYKKAAW